MTKTLTLKKYANRRLYDTEKSAYVTLNQVAETVKKGRTVRVVDAKTKEDVTAFILTQIILEEARKKNALLPVPLLHLIIRFGDNVLNEFFEKYLQQIIKNYLAYKNLFDEQYKRWLEMGNDLSEMGSTPFGNMSQFRSMFDLFSYSDASQKTGDSDTSDEDSG